MCVCVCAALVIQHANRLRRIALSYVTCLAVTYFSKLFQTVKIFGKTLREIKCVLFSLQLLCETFLILRRIVRDIINLESLHVKFPLLLSDFNQT